jgi:hypothetical protein
MSLLDLPVTTSQDIGKEYKPSVLGFAVKKSDYKNRIDAHKYLFTNKLHLGIVVGFVEE